MPKLRELSELKRRNHLKPQSIFTVAVFVEAFAYLAVFFSIPHLSQHQQDTVTALFCGYNVLTLLPTGSGKTFSFWGLLAWADFLFNGDPRSDSRLNASSSQFIRPLLIDGRAGGDLECAAMGDDTGPPRSRSE